ncbi:hypothetical protein CHCC20335_2184 [Bacillus paralicheniformis]|nr:hypothetical protein CHCC20335_2184 [Bacillus paralicheniformis]
MMVHIHIEKEGRVHETSAIFRDNREAEKWGSACFAACGMAKIPVFD